MLSVFLFTLFTSLTNLIAKEDATTKKIIDDMQPIFPLIQQIKHDPTTLNKVEIASDIENSLLTELKLLAFKRKDDRLSWYGHFKQLKENPHAHWTETFFYQTDRQKYLSTLIYFTKFNLPMIQNLFRSIDEKKKSMVGSTVGGAFIIEQYIRWLKNKNNITDLENNLLQRLIDAHSKITYLPIYREIAASIIEKETSSMNFFRIESNVCLVLGGCVTAYLVYSIIKFSTSP